jgi:uncharacterized protein with PCYCGC motif
MSDQPRGARPPGRTLAQYWWVGALILVVVVGAGLVVGWLSEAQQASSAPVVAAAPSTSPMGTGYVRRETKPTLDPAQFVGKARTTHQVAREIPDVLDQMYCYCECDKSIGHKSLLSCYTDGHAAT